MKKFVCDFLRLDALRGFQILVLGRFDLLVVFDVRGSFGAWRTRPYTIVRPMKLLHTGNSEGVISRYLRIHGTASVDAIFTALTSLDTQARKSSRCAYGQFSALSWPRGGSPLRRSPTAANAS